jgi:hypothetical protein
MELLAISVNLDSLYPGEFVLLVPSQTASLSLLRAINVWLALIIVRHALQPAFVKFVIKIMPSRTRKPSATSVILWVTLSILLALITFVLLVSLDALLASMTTPALCATHRQTSS